MDKFYFIYGCIIVICCYACNSAPSENNNIVGTWENVLLDVKMVSLDGIEGKDSAVFVTKERWEEQLKIKPIRTTYEADSSWVSNYFDLKGENISRTSGKWWVNKDTLWMQTLKPKNELNLYTYKVNENKAWFKTTVDWDSDGTADDIYYGEQVRVGE